MIIQQIYTKCLAQASYYIESEGLAVIVDPIRDIDCYLEIASEVEKERLTGSRIK